MCSFVHKVALLLTVVLCDGTSVSFKYDDIVTKTKVELSPVHITVSLNEILVLVTPVVNCKDAIYQLRKPNGDLLRTRTSAAETKFNFYNTNTKFEGDNKPDWNTVIFKYITKQVQAMYPQNMYKVINLANDYDDKTTDVVYYEESKMNKNDFMIGPLQEEDHGNWMLSIYCKDIDGEWIEMFQVITVEIISYVEMNQSKVNLPEGSTFKLSFLYPIKDLESCELTAPRSATDRFFDRNRIELDKCGYVINNVTRSDQGRWRVIGVGRIVYEGIVTLTVGDDATYNEVQSAYY